MNCFVPSCKSTIGVPFPQNELLRDKWLQCLNIKHLKPQKWSFICLDHFDEADICSVGGKRTIKSTSLPLKKKPSTKMCRVCTEETNLVSNISALLEDGIPIISVLMKCCYPIRINLNDSLPKEICGRCLNDLIIAHRLRTRCLESGKELQKNYVTRLMLKKQQLENEKQECSENKEKNEEVVESIENIRREVEGYGLQKFLTTKQDTVVPLKIDNKDIKLLKCKEGSGLIGQKIVIKKKAIEKYSSSVGKYKCIVVPSVLNNYFVQANNFLYIYGIQKGDVRRLHCIVPTCAAFAEHVLDEHEITVIHCHNHPSASNDDQKKQMFFYIMSKRVQHDKSLNIQNLYEDFCRMEPDLRKLVPLRNVISEISKNEVVLYKRDVATFEEFFNDIENMRFFKYHFTISGHQFYQDKFSNDDGHLAVVFSNKDILDKFSYSQIMYVDASFKIDTAEDFKYQLVTVLLWVQNSYFPVLYAFVNEKSQDIFKQIFQHLHDYLAPTLQPKEIVTNFESNLYHALSEVYCYSQIGGSVFYYTQYLYKKVCSLNLSRELETNSAFRGLYHMLLMLPLLPVNTIMDGFTNIKTHAKESGLEDVIKSLLDYIYDEWICNVTPELFCVHRLENRLNENVIAPFKKLRDLLLINKGKSSKTHLTIAQVIEKIIDLEAFLSDMYSKEDKRSFGRDLSSSQKKNVIRAWLYIESHPKINIHNFFNKVLGYIKCMENQLWIWGYYRCKGDGDDEVLVSAMDITEERPGKANVSEEKDQSEETQEMEKISEEHVEETVEDSPLIIVDCMLDDSGKVVIKSKVALKIGN